MSPAAAEVSVHQEQLNQPVERLSGGERARVLIAKLMLEPADLLLLDEPTNDLDIATLEILEETLLEYTGALVLVTHDRYMLDRVSAIVLGLDGLGNAETFADYSQWEQWQREQGSANSDGSSSDATATPVKSAQSSSNVGKKKLSYLEAREYATIEDQRAGRRRVPEHSTRSAGRSGRRHQRRCADRRAARDGSSAGRR